MAAHLDITPQRFATAVSTAAVSCGMTSDAPTRPWVSVLIGRSPNGGKNHALLARRVP